MAAVFGTLGEDSRETCILCSKQIECLDNHILKDCRQVDEARKKVDKPPKEKYKGIHGPWSCKLLVDTVLCTDTRWGMP